MKIAASGEFPWGASMTLEPDYEYPGTHLEKPAEVDNSAVHISGRDIQALKVEWSGVRIMLIRTDRKPVRILAYIEDAKHRE